MDADDLRNILRPLRRRIESDLSRLDRILLWDDALGLAIEERTGQPAPDGAEYTEVDFDRATEIMKLFPGKDA